MSNFFESEIIRNELKEINKLQESVYGSMLTFGDMEREDQLEHALAEVRLRVLLLLEHVHCLVDPRCARRAPCRGTAERNGRARQPAA